MDEEVEINFSDINSLKYEKSLKNMTSGPSREVKRHRGNCSSETGSRPGPHKREAQDLKDIINYNAIDYVQTSLSYRKTAAPKIVPFNSRTGEEQTHVVTNRQIQNKKITKTDKNSPSMCVELAQIKPLLFLANVNAVLDYPCQETFQQIFSVDSHRKNSHYSYWKITENNGKGKKTLPQLHVVINLSNQNLSHLPSYKVYNIAMSDCRKIAYKDFCSILTSVIDIIDNYPENPITICCDKGVNRSVAMIMGYAIQKRIMNYEQVLDYITSAKVEVYNNWSSLHNLSFVHYLQLIDKL